MTKINTENRSKEAYASYKANYEKKDTVKVAGYQRKWASSGMGSYSPETRYTRRVTIYQRYNYSPPAYVVHFAPSYGIWDSPFLMMMLLNMGTHEMYYHHMDDPGMQAWRRDVERQAQDNAELRAKVNQLDQEVAQMKAQGVRRDPNYVPPGMDKDVMLSDRVLPQQNVCNNCHGA